MLLNFRKTIASTRRCTFPGCETPTDEIRRVKNSEQLRALKMKNIYIPKDARVCRNHQSENLWNVEMQHENMSFTRKQVEDLITLFSESVKELQDTPSPVGPDNTKTMVTYIGLTVDQYENILRVLLPSLLRIYKTLDRAKAALYMYLMKLRSGFTLRQIAPFFKITHKYVSLRIARVREIFHSVFVPLHLLNFTREDLLKNTTPLSRRLYNVKDDKAVLTFDGTYIYTIISSNYRFQKESYSMQKHRNLVKFMMCVSTNGLILGAYGPFPATQNDAAILTTIMQQNNTIFDLLHRGDVVVLDRGFRDCLRLVRNRGLIVKIPSFTNKAQFTKNEANVSRNATKTRFVVEVKNGHVKNKWKLLKAVQAYQSIPKLKKDFQNSVALLNAFSERILSDKKDWIAVADTMKARANVTYDMLSSVNRIPKNLFIDVHNLSLFPKMTHEDLKRISQGTYQINQARSYVQMHMRANDNIFVIKMCDAATFRKYYKKANQYTNPLLLMINLPSRFVSTKKHTTYVLLDECDNQYSLKQYSCSCPNGKRTVGCCSHVMTIIWYTIHIDHNKLRLPSENLNHIFEHI